MLEKIKVIDSHTAGEPTRVVIDGGPDLGGGSMAERRERFAAQFDAYRSAIVNEPRGWDAMVGALLCEPQDPQHVAGILFFNNVGCLGMCVHGTIGVVATLAHLGRISAGTHSLETPVGVITVELEESGAVTVENVLSYRTQANVAIEVAGLGTVHGDVAWAGNWFFLVSDHGLKVELNNVQQLLKVAWDIRRTLEASQITGDDGGQIDHIELFAQPVNAIADSKNFVLCPGGAYDRSPCGTGTSAKLACLAAAGKLAEGELWCQASILNTVFTGTYRQVEKGIIPRIKGQAFVNAESTLLLDPNDPFQMGIRNC